MSIGSRKNDHIEKIQIILQLIIRLSTLLLFKVLFKMEIVGRNKRLLSSRLLKKRKGTYICSEPYK